MRGIHTMHSIITIFSLYISKDHELLDIVLKLRYINFIQYFFKEL
jgi:hypothetical protein